MKVKVYVLNSFAKDKGGGNPAGVVLDNYNLTDKHMLKIAQEMGFSEVAFVQKSSKADFKVRFITPTSEVDLCGHATIATFSLLKDLEMIEPGKYIQETKAGILQIEVNNTGMVFMNQKLPTYYDVLTKEEICRCLNLNEDDFIIDLPIQIVSTGLKDIIVPVIDLKRLDYIKPDFDRIKQISEKYDVVGIHAFTLDSKDGATAQCRNFAPLFGIEEESATGTSNGALGCYLYKYNKIKPESVNDIKIEQGYQIGKPSEILVKLVLDNNIINEVQVGGMATRVNEKEIIIDTMPSDLEREE